MKKEKLLIVVTFALMLSASLTLAATTNSSILFVGKIFSEKLSGELLGGVQIEIKCSSTTVKGVSDSNQSKGSYAVSLSSDKCPEGSPLSYTLSKSGYKTQTFSGFYDHTNLSNPNFIKVGEDEVFVVNFVLQKQGSKKTSSGGSSGGSGGGRCKSLFWDCSSNWTECSNGTQTRTCISNCRDTKTETRKCPSENTPSNKTAANLNITNEIETNTPNKSTGFISRITGAFAGPSGKKKLTVVILILLAIIGFYGLLRGKEEEEEENEEKQEKPKEEKKEKTEKPKEAKKEESKE